jgi:hypothetical protein
MATIKSEYASGKLPAPIPVAQEVLSAKVKLTLLAAEVAAGNVLQLLVLPADTVPVGYVLNVDDLDSGAAAVTLDLGILNEAGDGISTAAADGGDEWLDGNTVGQAGGLVLHTATKAAYDVLGAVEASDEDRIVAVVVGVAPGTAQGGDVELELFYKAV